MTTSNTARLAEPLSRAPDLPRQPHPTLKRGAPHFTPTYGSWMNLVERWFSALTTKQLQRGAHDSVAELTNDINAWIEQWNNNPQPFVWTKTADEILQRLASYCTQITESDISTEST